MEKIKNCKRFIGIAIVKNLNTKARNEII
jgi:hypothetical protein